jgi:hypothetical protein
VNLFAFAFAAVAGFGVLSTATVWPVSFPNRNGQGRQGRRIKKLEPRSKFKMAKEGLPVIVSVKCALLNLFLHF